jgi:SAM-dependent methyltransferase
MHAEAHDGARKMLAASGLDPNGVYRGLDLGGANVNGNARDLFPNTTWVGLDIAPGPGVDIVADARDWQPTQWFDVVLSTELLEHVTPWQKCVYTARKALKHGGVLILTCAGPGRSPHNCRGNDHMGENEPYNNVDPLILERVLSGLFAEWQVSFQAEHFDTYAWARA